MGKMKDLAIEQRNKALSGGGELLISDEEAARIARAAFRHNELFDQIENAVSTQHAPHGVARKEKVMPAQHVYAVNFEAKGVSGNRHQVGTITHVVMGDEQTVQLQGSCADRRECAQPYTRAVELKMYIQAATEVDALTYSQAYVDSMTGVEGIQFEPASYLPVSRTTLHDTEGKG